MTALAEKRIAEAPEIEVLRQSALWSAAPEAEAVVIGAIRAAAETVADANGDVAVVLTDDAAIRALNRDCASSTRRPTCCPFPTPKPPIVSGKKLPLMAEAPALLGDIVIAYETTAQEALAEGKPFSHHLAHLAVHGFLHLLGYDHESEAAAQGHGAP